MAKPPIPPAKTAEDSDPSMDDILASIRRILDDDQAPKPPGGDVLVLDPSMMVDDAAGRRDEPDGSPAPALAEPQIAPTPIGTPQETTEMSPPSQQSAPALPAPALHAPVEREAAPARKEASPLVAPEAAAAAANSVGTLMRTLAAERNAAVSRGGATLEDLVREEMRPLLKAWLDAHLPPMVERAVQAEIERVVGRQAG